MFEGVAAKAILYLIGSVTVVGLVVGIYIYIDHRGYTRAEAKYQAIINTMVSQAKLDEANALLKKAQDEARFNAIQADLSKKQAKDAQDQLDVKEAALQALIDGDTDPNDSRWTQHDIDRVQNK